MGSLSNPTWIRNFIPILLLVILAMFCLTAVIAAEFDGGIFFFLLFWICLVVGIGLLVHKHAKELVDVPKLLLTH